MIIITTDKFIEKSSKIHNNKYGYSLVKYINSKTKVKIICFIHGVFEQSPNGHLSGQGCPFCNGGIKTTNEIFIKKAKKIHGDKYNYSLINYVNSNTKVKIICKIHGEFYQYPGHHINRKYGCPKCSNRYNYTTNEFIEKSKIIHNKYDYSLVNYINNKIKIKIICSEHGVFEQRPDDHLKGFGCHKCSKNYKLTTKTFIEKGNKVHINKYDYSLVEYKDSFFKVKIICPEHGIFKQRPNDHLNGSGCPLCNESKGEKNIRNILENNNIHFQTQKTFEKCKNILKLRYDFYLPEYNMCIEFDGKQHFEPIKHFGGEKRFKIQQNLDLIKNNYCKNNNINLLRIKYNEDIEDRLKVILTTN